jgi:hypothetical protein
MIGELITFGVGTPSSIKALLLAGLDAQLASGLDDVDDTTTVFVGASTSVAELSVTQQSGIPTYTVLLPLQRR